MRPFTPILIVALAAGVSPAAAQQVLEPPARVSRGLFGGGPPEDPARARNDLFLRVNFMGGYDDNVTPAGTSAQMALTRPSGYTANTDVNLAYVWGTPARSIDLSGGGYMNAYRNVGLPANFGGQLTLRAQTRVGRRDELGASIHSSYDPYFQLGAFNQPSVNGTVGVPTANTAYALDQSQSWSLNTDGSYTHNWSDRARLAGRYSFGSRRFDAGRAFDTDINAGSLALGLPMGRRTSFDASYRYADERSRQHDDPANHRSIVDQTLDGGIRFEKPLSATRHLSIAGGAGAIHVGGINYPRVDRFNFWEPSGYGKTEFDFHRSWSISGEYRRALSVLQGVTPDPFIQNTASVSIGGYLMRRLEGVLQAQYANARAGYSAGPLGPGRFDSYAATAQLRVQIASTWSAVVIYNRYQYQLDTAAQEALSLSPRVQRNAVRIGITWAQPLKSTRQPEPRRQPAKRK